MPSRLNCFLMYGERAMAISFQIAHLNSCPKSRTPPFPQTHGPNQILKTNATTKSPFRGCPMLKFKASLTFHKRSAYATFEKRPPCPLSYKHQGEACPSSVWRGMALFSRTHLSDKISSALCRGPSRGLHCNGPMVYTTSCSSRPKQGPLATQE
jgi:hypothetical protein